MCSNRVGKSSLTTRYVNRTHSTLHRATIGIDFVTKEVDIDGQAVILEVYGRNPKSLARLLNSRRLSSLFLFHSSDLGHRWHGEV